jgi:hypothetical protein
MAVSVQRPSPESAPDRESAQVRTFLQRRGGEVEELPCRLERGTILALWPPAFRADEACQRAA